MTDLEDLWNSLPTGEPPTAKILAEARRRNGPWRSLKRPLLSVGAVAALTGAFVAGTSISGPPDIPGSGPAGAGPAASPVAFLSDLAPAKSCEALLAAYVDRALAQVTARGWQQPGSYYDDRPYLVAGTGPWQGIYNRDLGSLDTAARMPGGYVPLGGPLKTTRVTASGTGTNVQETGVDEPDSVKTDGHLLVRLRDDDLLTYDVSGPAVRQLSSLRLSGIDDGQILLAGDTVIAIGADRESQRSDLTGAREGTRVQTISIADPAHPDVVDDVTYGAAVASAYQQGDTMRLVLATGLPDLPFVHPGKHLTNRAATIRNREVVKHSRLRDWLPGYDAGAGRQDLLACSDVAVPPSQVGLGTVAVVTFAAGAADRPDAFGLAGATTIAYQSANHLYLAATPVSSWWCGFCNRVAGSDTGTSYVFRFDLEADRAVEVASGEVEGTIRDRWSLDESGGQLRVLVGPSSETGNFSSIVTFRRHGDQLREAGRLDHLGRGEDVKSVRWQDDLALVVTYRSIDPLYVVDLRARPRLVAEVRVPGFSSYLHPLGSMRLVGIGEGPTGVGRGWGAQLGLFDVHDLDHPRRLDVTHYERGSQALAGADPRAFTWLPEHRTVLTVIERGRTGWLSIEHLAHGRLDNRMLRVEYGDDVAQVRTFGLPDGKVVLVTGERVRFLDL